MHYADKFSQLIFSESEWDVKTVLQQFHHSFLCRKITAKKSLRQCCPLFCCPLRKDNNASTPVLFLSFSFVAQTIRQSKAGF